MSTPVPDVTVNALGTAVPEIKAEAYFILGRNHHSKGDMKGALPYYTQACKLWPQFTLAQYRLAQVPIRILYNVIYAKLGADGTERLYSSSNISRGGSQTGAKHT